MTTEAERNQSPEPEERRELKVGIVGATGSAGRETANQMAEGNIPISAMVLFSSERSAGTVIEFRGEPIEVKELTTENYRGLDLVIMATEADVSREWAPRFLEDGARVIDMSSAFRMDPAVPLVVPEVPQSWDNATGPSPIAGSSSRPSGTGRQRTSGSTSSRPSRR